MVETAETDLAPVLVDKVDLGELAETFKPIMSLPAQDF
jgi:hypothetical protein